MASVFPQLRIQENHVPLKPASRLSRAMSWHSSGAILVFAGLQIAGVVALSGAPGGRALPFVALALLLLVAIPFAKRLERRWRALAATALPSVELLMAFRRDCGRLWRLALIVPTLWLGLFAVAARAAPLL